MEKVCVAIVTFNRKEYLCQLLDALDKSSYPIEMLVIVDNASSDGTCEKLYDRGIIQKYVTGEVTLSKWNFRDVYYFLSEENTGGSGGFNKVFEIALKYDWKYIWAMDDDVWPEPDCLEILVSHFSDNALTCVPSRTDMRFKDKVIIDFDLKNPFKLRSKRKKYLEKYSEWDFIKIEDMPFEGPIFERSVVEKVGLPDKNWFILFDDTDYAHRVRKVTEIHYIPSAILHKSIIPNRNGGSKYTWKQYYGLRNAMRFDMKYGENILVRKISPCLLRWTMCFKAAVRGRFNDIKIINRAYRDAVNNNMGMTVKPGEF